MGVFTISGRNLMLNAIKGTNPATQITHVGLFTKGANVTGLTSVTSTDTFTKVGHGLANGDLILLSALTGGTALVAGRPYYVVGVSGNNFQVAHTSGGAAVDHGTDVTAGTFNKLTEISGGSPAYARQVIAFNAAADGTMDDSTNGAVFDIPAGGVVDYVGYHSASTAGTLQALDDLTQESFSGQGTYTLTDADLDLLASGGS